MQGMSAKRRNASCCCGAITAQAVGDPIAVGACSCEQCQRRTGPAFGVSTYWSKANVTLSGETRLFVRDGQEGRKLNLYFCPNCGSTVYWENPARWPDGLGIAYGAFADLDLPPPTISVWEVTKHRWVSIPAHEHFPGNIPVVPSPSH